MKVSSNCTTAPDSHHFTKSLKISDIKLQVNGQQIKVAKSATFLGVTFD